MSKMNVLMVLSDQHHAGLLGCAGHHQIMTPQIDGFARTGVRFTNAYSQNTICTPSRVSILSGQYCHNHGIYGLSGPANFGLDNLMRRFKNAGYRTAGYGKLHLPNSPRNWLADDLDEFGDTYESVEGEIGNSEFLNELKDDGLADFEDSWHNDAEYGSTSISLDAMPSKLPYERTQEMYCARKAMEFIDSSDSAPFCIQVALQKPHHPLLPNRQFWDLYPEDVDLPETFALEPAGRPPHFAERWHGFRSMEWDYAREGESFEDGARRAWRGTLACVSQVDDVFGKLLTFLEERGLSENTIVIYGADHGCYHGIHGIPEKAPGICSDAVCRVPMIWRVPGVTEAGSVSDALVENVDMAPTLCSLTGVDPMMCVDGMDITGILAGEQTSIRNTAVTENAYSKSIRWERWRMVHYQRAMFGGEDVGELYDIERTLLETDNLYANKAFSGIRDEGRGILLEWLIETTRVVTTQPAVTLTKGRLGRKRYPVGTDGTAPNDVQPRFRDDNNLFYL